MIPGGVKRGKPRSSKPKKVVVKVPRPEVTVHAPKPKVVKVAPEAARPVTPKQRKAIERGVQKAATDTLVRTVKRAVQNVAKDTKLQSQQGPLRVTDTKAFREASKPSKAASSLQGAFDVEKKVVGKVTAPAVKVLHVSAIPGRAIGKQTEKLAKTLGAPKSVQTGSRLFGEFVLDPTTWASVGTAPVARKVAQAAGEAAYKDAAKAGATHAAATRLGEKAAKKAAEKAPQNRGIVVRLGGKSTSGRATAYVSRKTGVSKVATKVRESKPVQAVAQDISPGFRPKDVPEKEFTAIRGASREARAQTSRGRVEAISKAKALKKVLSKEDHAKVVNAIERGTVYDLPEHLRVPAREVELSFRKARRAEVKAGIRTPNRRRYFTHAIEDAEGQGKKVKVSGGKRVIRPEYAKGRKHQGTIQQIADKGGPEFSTNVPGVVAGRLSRSAQDVAQARFNRSLLSAGRKVEKGEKVEINADEALYRIEGSDLKKIPREEERRAINGDTSNLRILNESVIDTAYKSIAPGSSRRALGKGYDKVQGGFKLIATVPNPGFHMRNLYGDTFNAYLGQNTGKLAVNVGRSAKTLRRLGKQEEASRTLGAKVPRTDKGITVKGKYGGKQFISYDDLAKEAVESGAIRSGFISREIPELLRDTSKEASSREFGRHAKRLVQNREDLIRLATYIGARKEGKTAREAADYAAKHHFDYADLTETERAFFRRLLPFYTFTRKDIPLQAKTLLTRPGKYANIEKIREEAASAAGLPEDWQARIPEYQQRGVPFPVVVGGKALLVSPSLPIGDLNQLTLPNVTSDDFGAAFSEQGKKFLSMLNPVVKSPIELYANRNFFFRSDIKNKDYPLVAAPSYVAAFPKSWRQKLGIVNDYIDKRSGKKGWGWPANLDYAAKVVPGPPSFIQQALSPLSNRRGQGQAGKIVSYVAGLKPDPYDPVTGGIAAARAALDKLEERRGALGQRGQGSVQSGRRETKEYRKVRDQIKELEAYIEVLKARRGDATKKVKKSSDNPFDSVDHSDENPFDKVTTGAKNPFD